MPNKPIIQLDLNGTVHAYRDGWRKDGPLYDPPTDGFKDWASEVSREFDLYICPAHMNSARDFRLIRKWFRKHDLDHIGLVLSAESPRGLKFKIDDRALNFTGDWRDFPLDMLRNFRTWSGR